MSNSTVQPQTRVPTPWVATFWPGTRGEYVRRAATADHVLELAQAGLAGSAHRCFEAVQTDTEAHIDCRSLHRP